MGDKGERGEGKRASEWKTERERASERERGREGGRGARAATAPVVLAAETRRTQTQRTVPAPLDGSPQTGGGTNLPPLPGNQPRRRRAHFHSSKPFLRLNIKKTRKRKKRKITSGERIVHASLPAECCRFSATDSTLDRRSDWT